MGSLKAFASAFGASWVTFMSGSASLIMALIAGTSGSPHAHWWWVAAYICGIFAAFSIWEAEWSKPGPQVIVVYESSQTKQPSDMPFNEYRESRELGMDSRMIPMTLTNLCEIPAINVTIKSIRLAGNTADFPVISRVQKDTSVKLSPVVREFGNLQARDFHYFLRKGMESRRSRKSVCERL